MSTSGMNGNLKFLDEVATVMGRGLVIGRMGDGKLLVAVGKISGKPESTRGAGRNVVMGWCEVCQVGYLGEHGHTPPPAPGRSGMNAEPCAPTGGEDE